MTVAYHTGNNLDILRTMPDNSVDSVVTDPPYELGFMGKKWDSTGIANSVELWSEVLRVLKPGGHLLAFSGTRTYHRMACAIEDAGFEIRDCIEWVYASGFPKSLNVGKAVDNAQGNERDDLGKHPNARETLGNIHICKKNGSGRLTKGTSPFEGFGTALKPAHEPICFARKPLSEPTVAANVLKWGTGGINIDGSRVGDNGARNNGCKPDQDGYAKNEVYGKFKATERVDYNMGRFPANLIHDNSPEVVAMFPHSTSGEMNCVSQGKNYGIYGKFNPTTAVSHKSEGSASRFFKACEFTEEDYPPIYYCAKASRSERNKGLDGFDAKQIDPSRKVGNPGGDNPRNRGVKEALNHHATVKPVNLMRYLCRLITPPGGTILDPFCGSGTTGIGAVKEGFSVILIDQEKEYMDITQARVAHAMLKTLQENSQLTLSL